MLLTADGRDFRERRSPPQTNEASSTHTEKSTTPPEKPFSAWVALGFLCLHLAALLAICASFLRVNKVNKVNKASPVSKVNKASPVSTGSRHWCA